MLTTYDLKHRYNHKFMSALSIHNILRFQLNYLLHSLYLPGTRTNVTTIQAFSLTLKRQRGVVNRLMGSAKYYRYQLAKQPRPGTGVNKN